MNDKERVETIAAAIAASVLGARAERRDRGGTQTRDFDLVFPDGHVEAMEVTRHFDQAASETWERLRRTGSPAPTLTRAWAVDVPARQRGPSGEPEPYGVREFFRAAEPALRRIEEAGYTSFDLGLGTRDPSVADARDTLLRLGVQFGISREVPRELLGASRPSRPSAGSPIPSPLRRPSSARPRTPGTGRSCANRRTPFGGTSSSSSTPRREARTTRSTEVSSAAPRNFRNPSRRHGRSRVIASS
jgi:hypothetical protein